MNTHCTPQRGLLLAAAYLGLITVACDSGDGGGNDTPDAAASMSASNSASASASSSASATASGAGGTGMMAQPTGMGGAGATGGVGGNMMGGAGGMMAGPVCDVPSLGVFSRSDTDASWDDNDFSDVTVETGCPLLVDVTWPHEEGWENADPSEANSEQVHFTLDSYYSEDLTNKQLNLTIELTDDVRGPNATSGGYLVSLVSVSTYDQVVEVEPTVTEAPPAEVLTDAGMSDASVAMSDAGAAMGMDAASDAAVEPMTVTQTGYSEAESRPEDRLIMRHPGDRATITFALPNKTEKVDSYDPTRPIKINVRIYSMFGLEGLFTPPMEEEPSASMPPEMMSEVDAGMMSMDAGMMDAGAAADSGASADQAMSDEMAMSMDAGAATTPAATGYDYISAQFAITNFTVTDIGPPPPVETTPATP